MAPLDFTEAVAKWLNGHGAITDAEVVPGATEGRVALTPEASHRFRDGAVRS